MCEVADVGGLGGLGGQRLVGHRDWDVRGRGERDPERRAKALRPRTMLDAQFNRRRPMRFRRTRLHRMAALLVIAIPLVAMGTIAYHWLTGKQSNSLPQIVRRSASDNAISPNQ